MRGITNTWKSSNKSWIIGLIFCFFGFIQAGNAQIEFQRLGGGIDIGYAGGMAGFNDFGSRGFAYNFHVYYATSDRVKYGIEMDNSLVFTKFSDTTNTWNSWIFSSYSPKVWYSFTTGRIQPYVAIGTGLSRIREENGEDPVTKLTIKGKRRWSLDLQPEVGVQAYFFYAALRYHVGSKTPKDLGYNVGQENIFSTNYNIVVGARYTIGGFNLD